MREKLQALLTERARLFESMKEIAERGFDVAENREQYDAMEADMKTIEVEISAIESHLDRDARMGELSAEVAPVETPETPDEERGIDFDAAFDTYLRNGLKALDAEERSAVTATMVNHETRALGTVAGPAGGYTVPEGFWNQVVDARAAFGGLRSAPVTTLTTAEGNDLPVPTGDDDSGNAGVYIGENTVNTEQDLAFDQKVLKAFTITTKIIRVPNELLQDSAFNIEAYIAGKFGERIGRGEATAFITGSGLQGPEGLITAAPVGVTAGDTNSFTYAELVNMVHSIDPAYRVGPSTAWLIGDDFLANMRKLTVSSTDNRPLWMPSLTVGTPNTILEYPYFVDQGIVALATSATVGVFGDLSAYWIRDVAGMQIRRLEERYAEYNQVGFIGYARNDAKLIDAGTNPIKSFLMSS